MTRKNNICLDANKDALLGVQSTKGWIFDSILLIPFMGVQFFANIGFAWPFALIRLAISGSILLAYFVQKEKPENKIFAGFFIIFLLFTVSIILNDGNVLDAISRYYGFLMIICLVNIRRNKITRLCYSILFTSELLIYSNLFVLTLYPYPDGLFFSEEGNPHWVIGQKQDFVIVFLPCIISSLFLWFNKVARLRIILVILAMVTTLSLVLTLGLTLVLFVLIFLVFYSFSTNRSIKGTFLFYSYIVMEGVCIFVALSKETTQIVFFYLDYLRSSDDANVSKGDTMMQRINMWYDALHNIYGNFWGLGALTEQRFDRLMPNSDYHPHVHNLLIDMAHTGGVLCALLYLSINYWTFKELDKISSTNRNILVYSLFVSNVIALTECTYWPLAVLPLALAQIYIYNYKKECKVSCRNNNHAKIVEK